MSTMIVPTYPPISSAALLDNFNRPDEALSAGAFWSDVAWLNSPIGTLNIVSDSVSLSTANGGTGNYWETSFPGETLEARLIPVSPPSGTMDFNLGISLATPSQSTTDGYAFRFLAVNTSGVGTPSIWTVVNSFYSTQLWVGSSMNHGSALGVRHLSGGAIQAFVGDSLIVTIVNTLTPVGGSIGFGIDGTGTVIYGAVTDFFGGPVRPLLGQYRVHASGRGAGW